MTVEHSKQFVFPDMIIEREESNKDLVTNVRNMDMGTQRKGTGRDIVANGESRDLVNNTMGISMDSNSEGLEKDTVSLNRTSPVRAQYKKGEKNLLRNDFSALNFIEDQPVCGNGTDFCSDPIAYPSKAIRKALRKQKRLIKSMFDTDLFRLRFRSGIDLYQGGRERVRHVHHPHHAQSCKEQERAVQVLGEWWGGQRGLHTTGENIPVFGSRGGLREGEDIYQGGDRVQAGVR